MCNNPDESRSSNQFTCQPCLSVAPLYIQKHRSVSRDNSDISQPNKATVSFIVSLELPIRKNSKTVNTACNVKKDIRKGKVEDSQLLLFQPEMRPVEMTGFTFYL